MLDKKDAHSTALIYLKANFYWDMNDPNSPFGAVEGFHSLKSYKKWISQNHNQKLEDLLTHILDKQGQLALKDYNQQLLNREKIQRYINDKKYDDFRFILQLDGRIIATILAHFIYTGQLVAQDIFIIAIERLILWNEYQEDFNAVCEQQIIQLYEMKQMLKAYQHKSRC